MLLDRDGDELEVHYRHVLESLGRQPGTLGTIFRKAQNRIQDPAKLRRLVVNLINEETWTSVDADLKGDAYESLLQKGAEDTKSGAGQYFTPRALTRAMIACLQPKPGETIADPACGTGGFLLTGHEWIVDHHIDTMDKDEKEFLRDGATSATNGPHRCTGWCRAASRSRGMTAAGCQSQEARYGPGHPMYTVGPLSHCSTQTGLPAVAPALRVGVDVGEPPVTWWALLIGAPPTAD